MDTQVNLGSGVRRGAMALMCLGAAALTGCATNSPAYQNEQTFQSPQSAVSALAGAVKESDAAELEALFGPDGHDVLSSGDPVADAHNREVFAVAMSQGWSLESTSSNTRELIVGNEQWPFPIPIVKDARGWWFNTEAGKLEVLARRIGRNELAAIGAMRTYVAAQREYVGEGHDAKPAGLYAQKIMSDPGLHNGLYWPPEPGSTDPAPLGEFAAQAAKEGYAGANQQGPAPFRGYYYRVLTRQGPAAPGGAKSYLVNGEMTAGFALLAFPVEYRNSGVMTFIVGPDGVVYESDLGPDTPIVAGAITEYNPAGAWRVVQ